MTSPFAQCRLSDIHVSLLSRKNTDAQACSESAHSSGAEPLSSHFASRRWFLPSQNQTSIRCLGPEGRHRRLSPTEVWQRLGRTLIPKLKGGAELHVGLDVSLSLDHDSANGLHHEIYQILQDLKLEDKVKIEWK